MPVTTTVTRPSFYFLLAAVCIAVAAVALLTDQPRVFFFTLFFIGGMSFGRGLGKIQRRR